MDDLEKLIKEYGDACIKAGQSNSGASFDISGNMWILEMEKKKRELILAIRVLRSKVKD